MRRLALALPLLSALVAPAAASSPEAWGAHEVAVRNACAGTSGLAGAAVSAPVRFSDRTGQDVVLVTGHATSRGAKAKTMLCLYDRRTKRAEVQDAGAWSRPTR
jgi:hypothetical protein